MSMSPTVTKGIFFYFLLALGTSYAQCSNPRYRDGATFVDTLSLLVTSISVPIGGFTPNGLICLAAAIRARFHDRNDITVNIFTSSSAASIAIHYSTHT